MGLAFDLSESCYTVSGRCSIISWIAFQKSISVYTVQLIWESTYFPWLSLTLSAIHFKNLCQQARWKCLNFPFNFHSFLSLVSVTIFFFFRIILILWELHILFIRGTYVSRACIFLESVFLVLNESFNFAYFFFNSSFYEVKFFNISLKAFVFTLIFKFYAGNTLFSL